MKRLAIAVALAAAFLAVVVLARGLSPAQGAGVPQQAQLVAAIDVTPLKNEIAALRAELGAIRQAVADAEGIRGDVAKSAAAVKAMGEQVEKLTGLLEKYTASTEPVIQALRPPRQWEYRVLRTRSEDVANRLGRDGWELVVASQTWLYFRRPVFAEAEVKPEE